MSEPTFISTPSGDEIVILLRADYDALVAAAGEAGEDAADLAVARIRWGAYEASGRVKLPQPVSDAVRKGDSLLKALRDWKDVTQMVLAQKADLTQGYISDLESGRKRGTPATLRAIAKALDVDPTWLVGADD